MFEIAIGEDELMRHIQGEDYWPLSFEELPVNEWYPPIATLSKKCTVLVWPGSERVH